MAQIKQQITGTIEFTETSCLIIIDNLLGKEGLMQEAGKLNKAKFHVLNKADISDPLNELLIMAFKYE